MRDSNFRTKKAVALRYSPDLEQAPRVTAKGSGAIADKILAKAQEHGVPIQEDASLVEILSKLDLEQEIPPDLYLVVAEILTFIYKIEGRGMERFERSSKAVGTKGGRGSDSLSSK